MKVNKVTDLIKEKYLTWKQGDIISLSAGTGSGKTYFVINILAKHAIENNELILYLIPRTKLKNQVLTRLRKAGVTNVEVKMYQAVEHSILHSENDTSWLQAYDYIICDESHYFTNDALFNANTEDSLKLILDASNAITLLMSATGELLIKYIKKFYSSRSIKEYPLLPDYSYIQKLSTYQSEEQLYASVEWLVDNNKKSIIFIQSDKKAYELYSKFKDKALFVCGVSSKYKKHVDNYQVEQMVDNEKFETLLLITTAALDVGFNIEDIEVQHIVIDMLDTDTFIQCLGRKRLVPGADEKVDVLFQNYNNNQIGGKLSMAQKNVSLGKQYYKVKAAKTEKHQRMSLNNMFYFDGASDVQINNMIYVKSALNVSRFKKYIEQPKGFIKEIQRLLGYEDKVYVLDELQYRQRELNILQKYEGVVYYSSKEAKVILQELNIKNAHYKVIKDFSEANKIFAERQYPYEFIVSKGYITDSMGKRKQTRTYTLNKTK